MSDGITISLTELLEQTIEKMITRLGGPVFGKIETFDQATDRASVTPLVPLWVDGELVQAPKVPSVPVLWLGSTAHRITWPLPAGSLVELAPLGCDHSQWLTSGTPNAPTTSTRRLSLSDLVAVPFAPSPMASPASAASYDATWAVLWGLWAIGSKAASKAVALHQDEVHKGAPGVDALALWMTQVETFINGLAPGTVAPLSTTFTKVGAVTATATKLKAE